jgi:hypothetical protein
MIRNDCKHYCLLPICLGTYVDGCDLQDREGRHLQSCSGCESFSDSGYFLSDSHPHYRKKPVDCKPSPVCKYKPCDPYCGVPDG